MKDVLESKRDPLEMVEDLFEKMKRETEEVVEGYLGSKMDSRRRKGISRGREEISR